MNNTRIVNATRIVNETTDTAVPRGAPAGAPACAPAPRPARRVAAHWVIGPALALAGALAARFLAPGFAGTPGAVISAAGHLAAGAGLLVIVLGVRRRVWQADAAARLAAGAEDGGGGGGGNPAAGGKAPAAGGKVPAAGGEK
ncbi:MAG: hypothetical protein LBC18_13445 [Opitutaceae bacterium]|nr:hypothetical protein [Opitutaceae bacterium]